MPQHHAYDVTIGKDTFEVSSDHELSDAQAYQAALAQSKAPQQSGLASSGRGSIGGAALTGLSGLLPIAQRGMEHIATSPTLPATAAKAGRFIGGMAPAIGGAYEAGPVGALAGLAAAAKGAWAGGKTGWFTGKLMQNMAGPVASGLEKIAPYAESLGPVPVYQQLGQYLKAMQDKESQKATPMAPNPPQVSTAMPLETPKAPPEGEAPEPLFSRLVKIGPETP